MTFFAMLIGLLIRSAAAANTIKVGDWWTDTNGNFIQGHGGVVTRVENYDCFNNGTKGCWVWFGEDKTWDFGIHGYASTDLYNWEDKGMALFTHEMMPEQLDGLGTGITHNIDNLRELKRRGNLKAPEEGVSEYDIKRAHDFLKAYATKTDEEGNFIEYDEMSLIVGFKYLYRKFATVERPKFIYNKKYNNYVIAFHMDGPGDWDIVDWIKNGMGDYGYSNYVRASIGFAVSDTPFGPYKLVNVQRMHWVEGWHDESRGMARDMTIYKDTDDMVYAIYSSEENQFMYISRLDDTYTTWATPQEFAKDRIDFKGRILDSWSREAPAIFKYDGYYYLMTSGCSGWAPNAATVHRSTMLYGPYEEIGNPCDGDGSDRTFDSQSTYFVDIDAANGKVMYFGDRWWSNDLEHSRYVWLPVYINKKEHRFNLYYTEEWKLEDFYDEDLIKFKSTSDNSLQSIVSNIKKKVTKVNIVTIAAITIGVVSLIAIVSIVIYTIRKKKDLKNTYNEV
ncbi:hypothetical protein TRFO_04361 [Tritrichomonas foetus]|uniref:Glycosyl hydrolase family 43 protein n=1 Tax=Tritrichomonas foetus TaxID=1144522 RepID=A0A1J4KJ41_9EUKA|nr:hypothetical protein TRFO_04361 [Tritrichomonas foetus]|eukprot:OHT09844.1 hypothetical protein TRFO_04361 [Tritrichomonas foetus]